MGYLLAIDQGTSSTTALLVNTLGEVMSSSSAYHKQRYPAPGFVEHVALDIQKAVAQSVSDAINKAGIKPYEILALGITNQRETLCLFDQQSKALTPFIVWQCRRSQALCDRFKNLGFEEELHNITGLYLDPYFSASKLLWLFEQDPNLLKKAQAGEILAGTVDSFLAHWFSNGACHVTDVTNASRTLLMDLKSCAWSERALEIFSLPQKCLPSIHKNIGPFGVTKNLSFLPDNIPIAALAGDQQAALFGQACFNTGDAKATFGTGCFILLNTGPKPIFSKHGLLSSVAYKIDDHAQYCLEGSAFIAGAATQFAIDAFGLIDSPQEIEALAASVKDNGGVSFVPALCGLGAPYWRPEARGAFMGLSRGTNKGHIARAILEGVALQNIDICDAMIEDAGRLLQLKVDGGASSDDLLMQIHADLLNIPCVRSKNPEQTALGVAYMAGLAIGVFKNLDQIKKLDKSSHLFSPSLDRSWTTQSIKAYRRALGAL